MRVKKKKKTQNMHKFINLHLIQVSSITFDMYIYLYTYKYPSKATIGFKFTSDGKYFRFSLYGRILVFWNEDYLY